jgi:hypothetical protein
MDVKPGPGETMRLLERGPDPHPGTIDIGDEVDLDRLSGNGRGLYRAAGSTGGIRYLGTADRPRGHGVPWKTAPWARRSN